MNGLFYTIFSNIDIFKVIKNTFIFISECVAMNLIFLGLACFVLYMCNNSYHVWISVFYARYFTILKSGDDNL